MQWGVPHGVLCPLFRSRWPGSGARLMAATLVMPRFAAANAVRFARRDLLNELRHAGSRSEAKERCAELLMACDPAIDGLAVFDLVRECRGVGRTRTREIMAEAGVVDSGATVGDILIGDAKRLAAVLRGER